MTQPNKPYTTFEELVEYVKAHPGEVSAAANGSVMELKIRQALKVAGIDEMVRWVSCSFSDAIVGLLGNNIDLIIGAEAKSYSYVQDGSAIVLLSTTTDAYDPSATFSGEDLEYVKSIPTLTDVFGDKAQKAAVEVRSFIAGPAGMDPELVQQIADCINSILDDPEFMERIHGLGATQYLTWTPEELTQWLPDLDVKIAGIYNAG